MAYLIAIPCILLSVILYFFLDPEYNFYHDFFIAIPIITGATIIFMKRAFEEWWYTKNPPRINKVYRSLLEKQFPYYMELATEQKEIFEKRVFLFDVTKEFEIKGMDEVPKDIKLLISATAVQLGLGIEKFNYEKLGVIVLFQKPFITPNIPTRHHYMEFNSEPDYDCVVLSMDAYVKGLKEPLNYYNIALHAFACSLQKELGIKDEEFYHEFYGSRDEFMTLLTNVRGFRLGYLPAISGKEDFDLFPVCVEHFFSVPERFQIAFPEIYEYLTKVLHQDPLYNKRPILFDVKDQEEGQRTGEA